MGKLTKQEVMEVLRHVYDPDYTDRSIVDMGLVTEEDVVVSDENVDVIYRLSAPMCPFSAAIGLMMKNVLEEKLNVTARIRLKTGQYQEEVVNQILSDEVKSRELMGKMESYGILEKCIRW